MTEVKTQPIEDFITKPYNDDTDPRLIRAISILEAYSFVHGFGMTTYHEDKVNCVLRIASEFSPSVPACTGKPNYTAMSPGELHRALGGDGYKFAEAFRQFHPDCNVDEGALLGWFCNACMGGHDAALGNPPLCGDHAEAICGNPY